MTPDEIEQARENLFKMVEACREMGVKMVWFGIEPETNKPLFFTDQAEFEIFVTRLQIIGFDYQKAYGIYYQYIQRLEALEGELFVFKVRPDHLLDEHTVLPAETAAMFDFPLAFGEFVMGKFIFEY